jgi:hypothetical protein
MKRLFFLLSLLSGALDASIALWRKLDGLPDAPTATYAQPHRAYSSAA